MKCAKFFLFLAGLVMAFQFVLPLEADAKLYTWKDRNGVIRRTYYPPPANQVWGNKPSHPTRTAKQPVRDNQVELYVTSWCPYCKKAIQFFKSKGVDYKVYDIEKDRKAAARKQKLDGRGGVPFAVVNGARIHGYAPEQYANALKE